VRLVPSVHHFLFFFLVDLPYLIFFLSSATTGKDDWMGKGEMERIRKGVREREIYSITPHPIPRPTILTPDNSLRSYIISTDQHESFVRTMSILMHTRENFPVGHPSQIAPSEAHLTWRFFRDRLPKKKMHLVGMDTLLILLSLGPEYHHPRGQDITIHPLRRPTSSLINPIQEPPLLATSMCLVSSYAMPCHVTTLDPHAPCTIYPNP
jgi:hypothetical protein